MTYSTVILNHRTLTTGSVVLGTEAQAPPYGYPGTPPSGWNEIDAGASPWQWVPQIRKAHAELVSGQLPLWSANVMLGAPLAADPINGLYNPLTWPLVARATTGAWDVWLLCRLLLAGLLCSALAMYLGLRPIPATIAGLVFMLSGGFLLRVGVIQTEVMALLPLLILAAEYCVRQPSRRAVGLLAGAVAITLLSGMPEQAFLCLVMCAVYLLVRYAAEWRSTGRKTRLRVAYVAAGGGVVGGLLSLPLLLPMIEYLRLGMTTHASTAQQATFTEDGGQLLRLVGPHWTGVTPYYNAAAYLSIDNWFGVGAIFLAMLGLFTRAFPRGVRTLMVLTAILVEAKVAGFPGWFNQFIASLPVINQIRLEAYSSVFVSLGVALLAGAGMQRIQLGAVRPRQALIIGLLLGALVAAAAPTLLTAGTVVWGSVALTATILIVVVEGARLAGRTSQLSRRVGVLMAAGGVTVELILLGGPGIPLAARYDPLSATPTTVFLQRVMPSGSGRSYSSTGILFPSTNQAFNLDDIRNLDAIYIERTFRYLKLFVATGITDRFDGLVPYDATFVHNPFLNALNVEYILVAPPVSAVAAPATDQFSLETVASDGVGIYRNRDATPRAQVVFDVATAGSEQQATSLMERPGFDPTRSAVVETGHAPPASSDPPVPAQMDSYRDDHVVITTTTTRPGTLVLADAYYPGWEATVDGKPATIDPVDIALRGVQVPAGTHTVTMSYRPQSVELGAMGIPAGLGLFAVSGWGVPAVLRLRRRSAPSPE